jgi:hypothetical protein
MNTSGMPGTGLGTKGVTKKNHGPVPGHKPLKTFYLGFLGEEAFGF